MAKSKQPPSRLGANTPPKQLSIEDTVTSLRRVIKPGVKRSEAGFDPYQGTLSSKPSPRKKDLRKVEEWLKAKRLAEETRRREENPDQSEQESPKPPRR